MERTKRRRVLRSTDGTIDLDRQISQEDFAYIVGQITQQEVSKLLRYNVLSPDGTGKEWLRLYFRFLQGQAYARRGWQGLEW